ncbi:unnamed protein product (macronuclear) [Paramecium tetraurelia]|uniref:Uncharacterized protein n=1 Tax=Paramecium tetraurelia TaxID=5888 RepID=A0CDH9_PARTE|nr:uncharacterized protein GSPATT00007057001 [Paramecium tetraurelia]CAK68846.1 unnamed protein product [Paramecium tetraurelia]|eukprot:XP_001436243.1 hypothetical protein (macronuclear) [Paramecium tetraurelia strain d4-2]
MLDFEEDFYKFVKAQLEKKKGIKQIGTEESYDDEDTLKKNRLVSQNINKVLQNERKKMKINKISKEQHFENKMKDFANMDTFIDVKQFLKSLNDQQRKKTQKKVFKSFKRSPSDSDNDDLFDYAEIVSKSKKYIAKTQKYRTKPNISGYLQFDENAHQKTEEIEEGKSTNQKFYTGIDKLITDINQKNAQSEIDKQYEKEKKRHRDSISSEQQIPQALHLDFGKDELTIKQGRKFKEQSQKVLQLLEKTTKMLYKNRIPQPPNPKVLKQQQQQLKELQQHPSSVENRSSKQILIKSRSISKDIKLPTINGPTQGGQVGKRIGPLHHFSQGTLPEIKPGSFVSLRDDRRLEDLHYFKSQNVISKQNHPTNNFSHHSLSLDVKNQIGDFITQLENAQEQFSKMYPSDSQLQKIQNNMTKKMNTIGKAPLESLKYLTRRKFNVSKKFETKSKKNKALQMF